MTHWDFSGYNAITTEPIGWQMSWYWDASHYRRDVGDMILDRMFGLPHRTGPERFGTRVTQGTIEPHLARFDSERELWLATNPKGIALVDRILQD